VPVRVSQLYVSPISVGQARNKLKPVSNLCLRAGVGVVDSTQVLSETGGGGNVTGSYLFY